MYFVAPIIYQVHRARDGKSFATRRVDARQRGIVMFTLLCSFQVMQNKKMLIAMHGNDVTMQHIFALSNHW